MAIHSDRQSDKSVDKSAEHAANQPRVGVIAQIVSAVGVGAAGGATERRTRRRAKTDLFVNRFLNGHPYLCRMTDLSLSGARLVAINEPRISPPPLFMGLQFQLPGRREIVTASGQTVEEEINDDGGRAVSIRFTRLPASAAAAIEAFVAAA
jgi:PilZ domain